MLNRRCAVVLTLACLFAVPQPARADGLISWLGKLSGPGPWIGANADFCVEAFGYEKRSGTGTESVFISCGVPLDKPHWSWNLSIGAGFALDNGLDYAGQNIAGTSDRVTYIRLGSSLMRTARKGLDLGFGGGVMFFQGPRFSNFGMPYIQPIKVAIRPGMFGEHDCWPWLMLTADWVMLVGTIDGAKFGAPADPLRVRNENLMQFGVTIDLPRIRGRS